MLSARTKNGAERIQAAQTLDKLKPKSNKTMLVTGATGFNRVSSRGVPSGQGMGRVGTYRTRETHPPLEFPNLRFVLCDLRDRRQANRLFQGIEFPRVSHLGDAQSLPTLSWKDPVLTSSRTF